MCWVSIAASNRKFEVQLWCFGSTASGKNKYIYHLQQIQVIFVDDDENNIQTFCDETEIPEENLIHVASEEYNASFNNGTRFSSEVQILSSEGEENPIPWKVELIRVVDVDTISSPASNGPRHRSGLFLSKLHKESCCAEVEEMASEESRIVTANLHVKIVEGESGVVVDHVGEDIDRAEIKEAVRGVFESTLRDLFPGLPAAFDKDEVELIWNNTGDEVPSDELVFHVRILADRAQRRVCQSSKAYHGGGFDICEQLHEFLQKSSNQKQDLHGAHIFAEAFAANADATAKSYFFAHMQKMWDLVRKLQAAHSSSESSGDTFACLAGCISDGKESRGSAQDDQGKGLSACPGTTVEIDADKPDEHDSSKGAKQASSSDSKSSGDIFESAVSDYDFFSCDDEWWYFCLRFLMKGRKIASHRF